MRHIKIQGSLQHLLEMSLLWLEVLKHIKILNGILQKKISISFVNWLTINNEMIEMSFTVKFALHVWLNKKWDVQEEGIITEADLLWILVIHMGTDLVEGKKKGKGALDAEGIISKNVKAGEVKTFYWGAVKSKIYMLLFA